MGPRQMGLKHRIEKSYGLNTVRLHPPLEQQKEVNHPENDRIRYKLLFENMSSGVAVYEAVDDGRDFIFKDLNRAGQQIDRTKKEDVIGKKVTKVFPGIIEFGLLDIFRQVFKTGKPIQYPTAMYKDKRLVGWRINYVYKLPTGEIVSVYDDVTKHENARLALEKSEAKFRGITENSSDITLIIDKDKVCKYVSPSISKKGNYTPEQLIGQYPRKFVHPDDIDRIEKILEQTIQEPKKIHQLETFRARRNDGSYAYLDGLFSNMIDVPGINGIVVNCRDITERKEIELEREWLICELEENNAELESFTYSVSHDLRSPLVTIKGFLDLLTEDIQNDSEQSIAEDVAIIQNAASKMQKLLDKLLELSRLGKTRCEYENISLTQIAKDATRLLAGQIEECRAEIDISEKLPTIYADRMEMTSLFQNLLDNALKFRLDNKKPEIKIDIVHENDESVIYIKDNGIGIEQQDHQRVFNMFQRLDSNHDGVGAGLALVERIVEINGGKIWIESKGNNKGTTFCFTIKGKSPK